MIRRIGRLTPPHRPTRTAAAVVAALGVATVAPLAATVTTVATAAPAGAAAPGACPDRSGVTVVVDFGRLGGGVEVRCAPGGQPNGFAALAAVGFTVTRAATTAGFLCRIDQRPAEDPCINPSPADAYWSYWVAEPGGRWRYSDVGAAFDGTAEDGTVQGWRFTDETRQQPAIAPPALPVSAPPSAPFPASPAPPVADAPAAPVPGRGGGGAAAPAPSSPAGGSSSGAPPASVQGATTTPAPAGDAAPGAGDTTTSTTVPGATTTAPEPARRSTRDRPRDGDGDRGEVARAGDTVRDEGGGGPPAGLLVGGAATLGLGIAAAFVSRIRRIG